MVPLFTMHFLILHKTNAVLSPIFWFQTDGNGIPQHLLAELVDSPDPSLRASINLGTETLTLQMALPVSPLDGIASADILMRFGNGYLNVTRDVTTCDLSPRCFVSTKVEEELNVFARLYLNGAFYVGNLPTLTPYARSKLVNTQGFRGCLGVWFFFFWHNFHLLVFI